MTELSEYAADVDVGFAREAIRAVGRIALKCYDINGVVDRLLQFLEMETDYVTAETLVLVKDLLRKYPEWSQDCLAVVGTVSGQVRPVTSAGRVYQVDCQHCSLRQLPVVVATETLELVKDLLRMHLERAQPGSPRTAWLLLARSVEHLIDDKLVWDM